MTTRRQLIQSIPALPLFTAAGATALLAACGKKEDAITTAPAPVSAAPAPAPAAAVSPAPAPEAATTTANAGSANTGSSSTAPAATAAAGSLVDEKDAQAVALGYVSVATKADKTKYPKYAEGQACANCALFQGGAAEQGPCPLFPGKQVASKAWCSAYAKKAA